MPLETVGVALIVHPTCSGDGPGKLLPGGRVGGIVAGRENTRRLERRNDPSVRGKDVPRHKIEAVFTSTGRRAREIGSETLAVFFDAVTVFASASIACVI